MSNLTDHLESRGFRFEPPRPQVRLSQRVGEAMVVRRYSARTCEAYLECCHTS